ncbi:hypothetical protein KFK09_012578 [Dendrobium nobile]|uniref:Integrase catalytic domain-containing protein n=1 Tax=Dendrobium nobile TaxID=94219 RepID=A0A8T3BHU8_DENNO|nr:hypothetical protein KFK09_012578 [Dendrobium nobile]
MATTSSSPATTSSVSGPISGNSSENTITSEYRQQLKFLMSHIKGVISLTLTAENFPLWRSQVFKLFKANGFEGFLDGSCTCPSSLHPTSANEISAQTWNLLDQNLAAALYSVISPSILPYVLSLDHCAEIWDTINRRLQSNTRSRTIQLRNELHHLSMKNQTMSQYLLAIKSIVDAIAATGSPLDPEEVIFYTLNGLAPQYQALKMAIRTNLQPISLDDLYTLLCSEELNLAQETTTALQNLSIADPATALAAYRGRGRGRNNAGRGRSSNRSRNRTEKNASNNITCQICSKTGHSAIKCWYRHDQSYTEETAKTALFTPSDSNTTSDWFLDSGASNHLTSEHSNLQSSKQYSGTQQITLGNGYQLPIQNSGKGILPTPTGTLYLQNLLHVPNLSFNLISIYRLTNDNKCTVKFSANGFCIQDSTTGQTLLRGPCVNGLYPIRSTATTANLALFSAQEVYNLWHRRLGHPARQTLQTARIYIPAICKTSYNNHCNACNVAKSRRLPFTSSNTTTSHCFDLVHSDIWGPSPATSTQGYKYYVAFIDDHSKFSWVFPLIHKSDAFTTFISFHKMINTQFNKSIKIFRSDGGGEFINGKFQQLFKQLGILHQYSCPYTPAQNGVAERKHRHIVETMRSILLDANLPTKLWVEVMNASVYLINRLPSRALMNQSPYQILYQKPPAYNHLKIFGCLCYPWLRPYSASKLSPFSIPCVFIV